MLKITANWGTALCILVSEFRTASVIRAVSSEVRTASIVMAMISL
jgi:hypothetical protein